MITYNLVDNENKGINTKKSHTYLRLTICTFTILLKIVTSDKSLPLKTNTIIIPLSAY